MDTLTAFLAHDHDAELLREAEQERLRRAALGGAPSRRPLGERLRPHFRLGRPRWSPRPTG